ncbi:MAG: tyrosine-type recombinase/integrase [Acidimicrobiales bacterium]
MHDITTHSAGVERAGPLDSATTRLIAGFLLAQTSTNTRKAYRSDLRIFHDWLTDHADSTPLLHATRAHVDAWARHGEEVERRRPSTIARRLTTLSAFYGYVIDEGVLDINPAGRVKRPKVGEGHVELTPGLDRDQARALLACAAAHGPRDHLLVLLLLTVGLRISEALSLDLDDIEEHRGHQSVLIRGKGGTENRVTLPPLAYSVARQIGDTGPMLHRDGVRWNRDQANRALTRLARRACLGRHVTPHMLRVTAITEALEADIPLRDVQDFARHADPRTTRRYDRARAGLDRHAATAAAIVARISA